MKSKSLVAVVLVVLLALAAYWYWSPFLAVRQLQTAAQNGDADAFNQHVDYPKVRESLKGQFSTLIARKLGVQKDSDNPFAALGSLIGLGVVNQLVDAMIRPETVMAAMTHGKLAQPAPSPAPAPGGATVATPPASTADGAATEKPEKKTSWIIDREGANRMTAYSVDPAKPDQPNVERLGLVFERSGFVDWKLTEIRMPLSAFQN